MVQVGCKDDVCQQYTLEEGKYLQIVQLYLQVLDKKITI